MNIPNLGVLAKIVPVIVSILVAVISILGSAGSSGNGALPAPADTASSVSPIQNSKYTQADLLKAINAHRTANGVKALSSEDTLNAKAQEWAQHMAASGNLVHSKYQFHTVNGVQYGIAENILSGTRGSSPAEMVQVWHKSTKGHSENQLFNNHSFVGVGLAYDATGRPWAVAMYALTFDQVNNLKAATKH